MSQEDFNLSNLDDLDLGDFDMDLNLDDMEKDLESMDDLGDFDTQPDDPTNSSSLLLDNLDSSKEVLDRTPPSSESQTQSQTQPFETPKNKANRRISFRSPIEDRQDSPSPLFVPKPKAQPKKQAKPNKNKKTQGTKKAEKLKNKANKIPQAKLPDVPHEAKTADFTPLKNKITQPKVNIPTGSPILPNVGKDTVAFDVDYEFSDALKENHEAAAIFKNIMGKAEIHLNALEHSTPDLSEVIKEQQELAQLRVRAEAAALKTARQELRKLDQQRDEMAKRMNNQGTRKAAIKSRLQNILKDRNMRKQTE